MLRHLLLEQSIFSDVKESSYEDLMAALPLRMPLLNRDIRGCELTSSSVRSGVQLVSGYSDKVAVPQLALFVSRWGLKMPDSAYAFLVFFLVLPELYRATEIRAGLKNEIEKIICDRFVLERVKIAETSEDVLEVLLREHHTPHEAVLAHHI